MDGRPNRRNKAAFSNSSGVVWVVPHLVSDGEIYERARVNLHCCAN